MNSVQQYTQRSNAYQIQSVQMGDPLIDPAPYEIYWRDVLVASKIPTNDVQLIKALIAVRLASLSVGRRSRLYHRLGKENIGYCEV